MNKRTKAIRTIEEKLCSVMAPGMGEDMLEALDISCRSLRLWDGFIERLADKCNGAVSQQEWQVYRSAIELIKAEFDEKIG